ncbi:hypothetical protein AB4J90_12050 [Geobacillus thermodenitrificans]|jgi:hypothetical protein|uniref:Uncharacterized protein n=2 Tax=Geobacillus thermodenitrificans TaxID=33940 RepID=A4IS94_GEOTN|nr:MULTISPECIES: hypothetical protein [Geobacillus]ABO68198.1 hypothetical protein GTNG_2853 [Geobacillus thermodenitrificans NG80-2]KQB92138.1 putative membrane protein [Geobacillus sp. PA-3]MED4830705.1 hypothetical protein [Geobacillus stearothermophilus]MED5040833.1 hypothetical protein [Geobacillus stearothermophilus]WMV75013.1 hypothetical protein HSX42_12015 [Geobacillus thermodenitrificans]
MKTWLKRFGEAYYRFLETDEDADTILRETKLGWLPYAVSGAILALILMGDYLF